MICLALLITALDLVSCGHDQWGRGVASHLTCLLYVGGSATALVSIRQPPALVWAGLARGKPPDRTASPCTVRVGERGVVRADGPKSVPGCLDNALYTC